MRYLSVCSGIEAATIAWHQLGWEPAAFSEIDAFPRAVLQHHYPNVPLHGDFTTITADQYGPVELLVGGTPCQSFSVAGLRLGLDDPRGNLALGFAQLAARLHPRWIVWENVPGVLSANRGRDLGAILGAMAELGYSFTYRVLDAQFFGVPQRRRRVFLVGHSSGDWRRPAAVLFEPDCLRRDSAPSRKARQTAPTIPSRRSAGCDGGLITMAHGQGGAEIAFNRGPTLTCVHEAPIVAHTLRGEGFDASEDGTGRGTPLVPIPFDTTQITSATNRSNPQPGLPCHPLAAAGHPPAIATRLAVRRLTPTECERLQGFPDGYTQIPWRKKPADQCPDGPRYKALGNSMAVPVMRWIGSRIAAVDALNEQR